MRDFAIGQPHFYYHFRDGQAIRALPVDFYISPDLIDDIRPPRFLRAARDNIRQLDYR